MMFKQILQFGAFLIGNIDERVLCPSDVIITFKLIVQP